MKRIKLTIELLKNWFSKNRNFLKNLTFLIINVAFLCFAIGVILPFLTTFKGLYLIILIYAAMRYIEWFGTLIIDALKEENNQKMKR